MNKFHVAETPHTPGVTFDPENGIFELRGRSIPENAERFYTPIMDWLDKFQPREGQDILVKVMLYYYNTASSKRVLELFRKFDEVFKKAINAGAKMKIVWEYESGDDDAQWDGETMSKILSVPFEFIEVPEET